MYTTIRIDAYAHTWMDRNRRKGVELSIYDEESETDDDAWMDKREEG